MKTALQELIEWLDKRIEDCNELGGLEIAKWAFIQGKKKATELLEKEREGIEEAFIDGQPTNQDKVREAAEWVSVYDDRMPDHNGYVLLYIPIDEDITSGEITIGVQVSDGETYFHVPEIGGKTDKALYWRELPELDFLNSKKN